MANSVEHAYYDADDEIATKWWAFAGVHKDKLIVVICDKGIGIRVLYLLNGGRLS